MLLPDDQKQNLTNEFPSYDENQSLEQLLRMALAKNKNLVIIIPEIMINIVSQMANGKYKMPVCYSHERAFKLNVELAKYYSLPVVVKFYHVPCSQYDASLTGMTYTQQYELAKEYHPFRDNNGTLDFHPSAMVHLMMAEFLLFYFQTTLSELKTKLNWEIPAPILPSTPLFNSSKMFDRDYYFDCRIEVSEPNIQKSQISDALGKKENNSLEYHFVFNNTSLKCGSEKGFQLSLSIAHLYNEDDDRSSFVQATFGFVSPDDLQPWLVGPVEYMFPLLGKKFGPVNIQKLIPTSKKPNPLSLCKKPALLSFIDVNLNNIPTNPEDDPLTMRALIVECHCC